MFKVGDNVTIYNLFKKYSLPCSHYKGDIGMIYGRRDNLYHIEFQNLNGRGYTQLVLREDEMELHGVKIKGS